MECDFFECQYDRPRFCGMPIIERNPLSPDVLESAWVLGPAITQHRAAFFDSPPFWNMCAKQCSEKLSMVLHSEMKQLVHDDIVLEAIVLSPRDMRRETSATP
jgi:hypothetical protein